MKKTLRSIATAVFFPSFVFAQNVGIGTTLPGYKLHVANASGEAGVGVNATGTAAQALVNLSIDNRIDGNALALIKYRSGVAGTTSGIPKSNLAVVAADAGAGALLISTNQASPIHFATNFVERMRIATNGFVGIGTATPVSLLHVKSNAVGDITAETTSGNNVARLNMQTNTGLSDASRFGNTVALTINGINYNNLTRFYSGGGPVMTGTSSNSPLYLVTSDMPRVMVLGEGNVGVNVTSTSFTQLHVKRSGPNSAAPAAELGAIYGENGVADAGSGVTGFSGAPRTGADGYAGVTGLNFSEATDRFGVIGQSSGTTSGSEYSAGVGGYGDYGVLGYSQSTKGAGVIAQHGLGLTALEINNGFIKSTGTAGNKTAFKHLTAVGNLFGNTTNLSYSNQSPDDILVVTHQYNTGAPGTTSGSYLNKAIGVYWNGSNWTIYTDDTSAMPTGIMFTVLVIKQ